MRLIKRSRIKRLRSDRIEKSKKDGVLLQSYKTSSVERASGKRLRKQKRYDSDYLDAEYLAAPTFSTSSIAEDDPDALEIEYLERKLGLCGPDKERNRKTLARQLHDLDGLDEDLLALTESIVASKNDRQNLLAASSESNPGRQSCDSSDTDDHDAAESDTDSNTRSVSNCSDVDDDTLTDVTDKDTQDVSHKTDDSSDSTSQIADDEEEGHTESSMEAIPSCSFSSQQPVASSSVYIPPAKRSLDAVSTPSSGSQNAVQVAVRHVQTRIVGLINRIAEGNLSPITQQIVNDIFLYASSKLPNQDPSLLALLMKDLSSRLAEQVVMTAIQNTYSTASLVGSQAAVVASLTTRLGYQIGEQFIISLVTMFEKHWRCLHPLETSKRELSEAELTKLSDIRTYLRLAVTAYSLLYDFGLLDASGVFAFIRRLFAIERDNISTAQSLETRLDLLLTCFRHVGTKFRATAPQDLREMLNFVSKALNTERNQSHATQRALYFMQELDDMQNNKLNLHSSERFAYIRSWLFTFFHQTKGTRQSSNSETFPAEYVFSVSSWLSVANGTEIPHCNASEQSASQQLTSLSHQSKRVLSHQTSLLMEKAKALRLHTDIQKATFVALVGAIDVHDAVQRIVEVAHQQHQVPHAVAVILHTGLQEKFFNGFYPQVLVDLACLPSSLGKRYKRATKQGIVAQLSEAHRFSVRQAMHFAKFLAWIMLSSSHIIDLRVLRFARFSDATGTEAQLLRFFLHQVCKELCSWKEHTEASSSGVETATVNQGEDQNSLFQHQVNSVQSCEDIAQMMVLAARQLLQEDLDNVTKNRVHLLTNLLTT